MSYNYYLTIRVFSRLSGQVERHKLYSKPSPFIFRKPSQPSVQNQTIVQPSSSDFYLTYQLYINDFCQGFGDYFILLRIMGFHYIAISIAVCVYCNAIPKAVLGRSGV